MTALTLTAQPLSTIQKILFLKKRTGEKKMPHAFKQAIFAFMALFVGLTNSTVAYADTNQALFHFTKLGEIQTNMANIQNQISSFAIKKSYCKAPHANDKSGDRASLDALLKQANALARQYNSRKSALIRIITNDGRARAAVGKVAPGGSGSLVDGSHFSGFTTMYAVLKNTHRNKSNALNNAPTRPCGGSPTANAAPVIAVPTPLAGLVTTVEFADVNVPSSRPTKFCSEDEKDELLYHLRELRFTARQNAVKARNLQTTLREKLAEIAANQNKAYQAADAAAKAGDASTLRTQTAAYNAYKAAAKKLTEKIEQAGANKLKWRGVVDAIDAEINAVKAIPVVDCSNGASMTEPVSDTSYPDVYEHVDNISLKTYTPFNVDITKTCFERVKVNYVMRASTEVSNAWYNLSEWQERLRQVGGHHDLLSHDANAAPELVAKMKAARDEARAEVAKWTKIKAEADANKAKADAIVVEDCSGEGGQTQIGRLHPGFKNISSDIYVPDLQDYDLPTIPERICSWEELESLRARAAKAREVSAHNRSEWGKRLNDLGKLLYMGDDAAAYPTRPELAAHLDAQRQYDYWSGQQDVAHKVYWDLMAMENVDCTQPEKKTSMGGYQNGGADKNTTGGSKLGALQDAMNNRPVFNGRSPRGGASNGSFYDQHRDLINGGGCAYPASGALELYRCPPAEEGFNGSEAESALKHTLDNVEPRHETSTDKSHGAYNNKGNKHNSSKVYANDHEVSHKSAEGKTINAFPDVKHSPNKETETPTGVPVPYPTTGMGSETAMGPKKVKVNDREIMVKDTSYKMSAPVENQTETMAPTTSNGKVEYQPLRNDVKTGPVEVEGPVVTSRTPQTISIPTGNRSNGGSMIQVAPPPLIINSQGQMIEPAYPGLDRSKQAEQEEQQMETQTGN